MSHSPLTVAPDTPILEAASYLGLKHLRCIPVVDKGQLLGMVSIWVFNKGFFSLSNLNPRKEIFGRMQGFWENPIPISGLEGVG